MLNNHASKSKIPKLIKTNTPRICFYGILLEFHKIAGNCQNEFTCNTWLFEEFDKNPRGNAHRKFFILVTETTICFSFIACKATYFSESSS